MDSLAIHHFKFGISVSLWATKYHLFPSPTNPILPYTWLHTSFTTPSSINHFTPQTAARSQPPFTLNMIEQQDTGKYFAEALIVRTISFGKHKLWPLPGLNLARVRNPSEHGKRIFPAHMDIIEKELCYKCVVKLFSWNNFDCWLVFVHITFTLKLCT